VSVLATVENTPLAWSERAESALEPWAACGWSVSGQQRRIAKAVELLQLRPGESLLDFGCGTGQLSEHLPAGIEYLGYDWASGMVDRARREHPRNFTYLEPSGVFDAVVCVGTFNLPGSVEETWATLRRLWSSARRALLVSLYAGVDPVCLRYGPAETAAFAQTLTSSWLLERHMPNDLMLLVRR
jgi:SAM-dependent methyltransferase